MFNLMLSFFKEHNFFLSIFSDLSRINWNNIFLWVGFQKTVENSDISVARKPNAD